MLDDDEEEDYGIGGDKLDEEDVTDIVNQKLGPSETDVAMAQLRDNQNSRKEYFEEEQMNSSMGFGANPNRPSS